MPKFSLEKTVNAERETVFQIMSNFENYQKILPQHFPSIRVRSTRDNVSVVEEHLNLGEHEFVIMAKHVTEKPITHEVFVIGGDAKGSHFKEEFIETPEGTKIFTEVDLKLKGKMKITGLLGKSKFAENYSKIIDDFLRLVEN